MVETRVIEVVSNDTVLVEKLTGLSGASSAAIKQKTADEELLFLFLKQLARATANEQLHELWIGVGRIIEITEKLLVVRYLIASPGAPIVGHSVHRPVSALAVWTNARRRLLGLLGIVADEADPRNESIDNLAYYFLKSARNLICPIAGCLFARERREKQLCKKCVDARNARSARLFRVDGLCLRCGDEAALSRDRPYCTKCYRREVRDFIRCENPDLRSLSDRGTDQLGRRVRDLNALAGSPDMTSTDEDE